MALAKSSSSVISREVGTIFLIILQHDGIIAVPLVKEITIYNYKYNHCSTHSVGRIMHKTWIIIR
jgi:hypothetical protein